MSNEGGTMLISCNTCPARGRACDTCVVTTFLGLPAVTVDEPTWEAEDHRVLDTLCAAGLVSTRDAADARLERTEFDGMRVAV